MIQRIQTVYLLLSFVILLLMLFLPLFEFNSGDYIFNSFQIQSKASTESIATFPIGIYIILTLVAHIFAIILFKNRVLQMRITTFLSIFLIGFYALLAFYYFVVINFEITEVKAQITLLIPLISAILVFMANKGIKKDEKLVRSADRIR